MTRNRLKTHCPHGHEYTPENTATQKHRKGYTCRSCLTCRRERERRARAERNRKLLSYDRIDRMVPGDGDLEERVRLLVRQVGRVR